MSDDPKFYFNANWVLGGKAIASQGPLKTEIEEFWEMLWHSDIKTIVMLANPIENGRDKCAEYWKASSKSQTISEETVFTEGAVQIVKRTIQVSKGRQTKSVVQYHLQNWPDFGVVSPAVLAQLVKVVSQESEGKPILAHCSAGVGRTGTFLAAYEAFHQKVDQIFTIASSLRNPNTGRVGMIQTAEQYGLAKKTAKLLLTK